MNQQIYKKELKPYFKKIKRNLLLTYSRRHTKSILQILEQNSATYFEENPTATFQDFIKHFGEPENLSPDIFQISFSHDSKRSLDSIAFKKRCFQIIATGVLICILLVAGFYLKIFWDVNHAEPIHRETITKYTD